MNLFVLTGQDILQQVFFLLLASDSCVLEVYSDLDVLT
jgi:hypothetical protein